jgi:uncharacterized metal-binding protein YceD (DUF177 family)
MKSNSGRRGNASGKDVAFRKPRRPEIAAIAPLSKDSPLSHLVEIEEIPEAGLRIAIRADEAARAAIAKADGLVAIQSLEADLEVAKESATKFRVAGPLRARVVQTCVVSLEAFESDIEAEVEAEFAVSAETRAPLPRGLRDAPFDGGASPTLAARLDAPEPIVDGRIDVGALAEEFFVLSLDPHPRKPGVQFDAEGFSQNSDDVASPFAVLKTLKDGD